MQAINIPVGRIVPSASFAYALLLLCVLLMVRWQRMRSKRMNIPRIGPNPSIWGNTSKGEFYNRSAEMVEEGYRKYGIKGQLFSLWTTNMDRVLLPPNLMDELNKVPRAWLKLTATLRHVGKYTGMDVADHGTLGFDVCIGPLTHNIGKLCQPIFKEVDHSLNQKLQDKKMSTGIYKAPMYFTLLELVTTSTARMFVGSELCRDKKWLDTASGYTVSVGAVTKDLQKHYQFLHPVVAPFMSSVKELKARHAEAASMLLPIFAQRRMLQSTEHQDMIQWLVEATRNQPYDPDGMIRRMMFLNMAAIHTTTHTLTNIILDLCDHPEYLGLIHEEMVRVVQETGTINNATLSGLKLLDSFMKESQRLNAMDLMVFNRAVVHPIDLSNGIKIPAGTYVSLPLHALCRDENRYPDPLEFKGDRFYKLRQKHDEARYQFSASDKDGPGWGFGKFACPGRFWAAAQIKIVLLSLLLRYEVAYPDGQTQRPADIVLGERRTPNRGQMMVLRRRPANEIPEPLR